MTPEVQPPPAWNEDQLNALFYLPPPYLPRPVVLIPTPPSYDADVDAPPPQSITKPPIGPTPQEIPPVPSPVVVSSLLWVEFPRVNWVMLQALYFQYVQAYIRTGDGWSSIASGPAAVGWATSMAEWYATAALIMGGDFLANVVTDGVTAWGRLPVRVIVTYSPTI